MAKRQKMQNIVLPDYGDEEINQLAQVLDALGAMNAEARLRALRFVKGRYPGEWPSDSY